MATRIDHTTCSHDRTPKERAACRARQREFDATMTSVREAKEVPLTPAQREASVVYLEQHRARKVTPTKVDGLSKVTDEEGRVVDWQVTPALVAKVQGKIAKRAKRTDPALRVADRRMAEIREAADRETWREARSAARKAALRVVSRPLQPSADGLDYGHCVQADLHRGGGRCACGWHTEGF